MRENTLDCTRLLPLKTFKINAFLCTVYDITPTTEVLSISENAMEIGKTYNFLIHIVLRETLVGAYGRNTVAV